MNVNIDLNAINELKRKAKAIEEEASVYDIGFDAPKKPKTNSQPKLVFAVSNGTDRLRRSSVFIETSQSSNDERNRKDGEKNQNAFGSTASFDLSTEHSPKIPNNTQLTEHNPIDLIVIPTTQTTLIENSTLDTTTIQLNAGMDDDLIEISSGVECETTAEPLLFKNGYFEIINEQGINIDAMCVACGFNENNEPKKVLKARKNVSSNLLSHFKVSVKCNINLMFISISTAFI